MFPEWRAREGSRAGVVSLLVTRVVVWGGREQRGHRGSWEREPRVWVRRRPFYQLSKARENWETTVQEIIGEIWSQV